jgi:AcrR family transcriptional regulator
MDRQSDQMIGSSRAAADVLSRVLERSPADTELRKRPTQERGIATFNAILDAAARLLQEGGLEVLTTNRIAEVAGVNIATLYQYFPGKEAILLELFRRDTDARVQATMSVFGRKDIHGGWREKLTGAMDVAVAYRRSQPGAAALRDAMRSVPDLRVHERKTLVESARAGGQALARRSGMDESQAFLVALCVAEAETALLDLWSLGHAGGLYFQDHRVIDEMKTMLAGYLAAVIEPDR